MRALFLTSVLITLVAGCDLYDQQVADAEQRVNSSVVTGDSELLSQIEDLTATVEALQARLNQVDSTLGDATGTFDSLDDRLDAIEGGGGEVDDRLTRLETEFGGQAETPEAGFTESRLDAVIDSNTSLLGSTSSLDVRVGVLETQAADPTTGAAALGTRVTALEADLLTVAADVVTTQADLLTTQTELVVAETGLLGAQGDINGLQAALDDGTGALLDVDAAIAAVQLSTDNAQQDADDALVAAGVNASAIGGLETEVGDAPTFASSRLDLLDADLSAVETALDDGTGALTDVDLALSTKIELLPGNTTWTVTSGQDLLDKIADLDGYHIPNDALLTLEIVAGTHVMPEAIVFNHPDGDRVQILGATGSANGVTLQFNDTDGLVLNNGSRLGLVDGLTLEQVGPNWVNTYGAIVQGNSTLEFGGPEVVIDGFGLGIYVRGSSHVLADGVSLTNNYQGAQAADTSALRLVSASVIGTGLNANSYVGVHAGNNSYVNANSVTVGGYSQWGLFAGAGGVMAAGGPTFPIANPNGTNTKEDTTPGDPRHLRYIP